MMFFIVGIGDDPWITVLITALFEMPCLFLVSVLVKFCPRKHLYMILYIPSMFAAGALVFTSKGESAAFDSGIISRETHLMTDCHAETR